MSVETQINRIKANIASAYAKAAEKGAALPISQNSANLPETIAGIPKGNDFSVPLKVSADAGAVITARLGEEEVRATADSDRSAILLLPAPGDWVVSAELDGKELAPKTVTIAGDYTTFFDFNAPVLPEGYVQLEYIESTNGQYITTPQGVVSSRLVMDVEPTNALSGTMKAFFGYCSYSSFVKTTYHTGFFGSSSGIFAAIGSNSGQLVKMSSDTSQRRMTVEIDTERKKVILDGEEKDESVSDSIKNLDMAMNLLSEYRSSSNAVPYAAISAKIYSFVGYDSVGNLTKKFIPCKNPLGVAGLYDSIANQFYSSETSEEFIPGPAV